MSSIGSLNENHAPAILATSWYIVSVPLEASRVEGQAVHDASQYVVSVPLAMSHLDVEMSLSVRLKTNLL